jgi:hypothetical protein
MYQSSRHRVCGFYSFQKKQALYHFPYFSSNILTLKHFTNSYCILEIDAQGFEMSFAAVNLLIFAFSAFISITNVDLVSWNVYLHLLHQAY